MVEPNQPRPKTQLQDTLSISDITPDSRGSKPQSNSNLGHSEYNTQSAVIYAVNLHDELNIRNPSVIMQLTDKLEFDGQFSTH